MTSSVDATSQEDLGHLIMESGRKVMGAECRGITRVWPVEGTLKSTGRLGLPARSQSIPHP